jgi:pilus assembly protein CpaB
VDTTSKVLFGVGGIVALLVGFAVYSLVGAAQLGRTGVIVVVANADIPERMQFTAANVAELLTTRELPGDAVPPTALRQPAEAIGKLTSAPIRAREVVLSDRLFTGEGVTARPAASIPRDMVALALAANERVVVAGAVQPGDRVDVIATWGPGSGQVATQDLFQDVRVFAVGRVQTGAGARPNPDAAPTTITLLVDYEQAVVLEHLLRTDGSIALVLRRFDQGGTVPVEPVSTESMLRRFRLDGATTAR